MTRDAPLCLLAERLSSELFMPIARACSRDLHDARAARRRCLRVRTMSKERRYLIISCRRCRAMPRRAGLFIYDEAFERRADEQPLFHAEIMLRGSFLPPEARDAPDRATRCLCAASYHGVLMQR